MFLAVSLCYNKGYFQTVSTVMLNMAKHLASVKRFLADVTLPIILAFILHLGTNFCWTY